VSESKILPKGGRGVRKITYFLTPIALVLGLFACGPPLAPIFLPSDLSSAMMVQPGTNGTPSTAVWDISANSNDFRGSQPTGAILLSSRSNRNSAICEAFIAGLPSASSVTSTNLRPTYWLWKGNYQGQNQDCSTLITNYDFDRADRIIAQVNQKLGLQLSNNNGPIFIGFVGRNNNSAFLLDGSNVPTNKLPEFVGNWKSQIIQDPEVLAQVQRANDSGSALAVGNTITPKSGSENSGFWMILWNTVGPILRQLAVDSVPIIIIIIKTWFHIG